MIFGMFEVENIVQVGDKTRIDCTKSFKTPEELVFTKCRIKPSTSDNWYEVSTTDDASTFYLDWVYADDGVKTITLELTVNSIAYPFTQTISVITEADDALFSKDHELIAEEPDILKWLPKGKSSYKYVHRRAQDKILIDIYKSRVLAKRLNGAVEPLVKSDFLRYNDVTEWSKYLVLQMIFEGRSNIVDDIYSQKAAKYKAEAIKAREMAFNIMLVDLNGDTLAGENELLDQRSGALIRR